MLSFPSRSLVLLFAVVVEVSGAAKCQRDGDNCARAVTGTTFGSAVYSSHFADCGSFFKYTTTPATSTVTVIATPSAVVGTVTQTSVTTVPYQAPVKRSTGPVSPGVVASPTLVPAYASACSGTVRYSSACSCFPGIVRTTVTAPTPLTTITVSASTSTSYTTVVTTTTTTSKAPAVCTAFAIQVRNPASQYDKQYLYIQQPDQTNAAATFTPNLDHPFLATFVLDSTGRLVVQNAAGVPNIFLGGDNFFAPSDIGTVPDDYIRNDPYGGIQGFIVCTRVGDALTCRNNAPNGYDGAVIEECSQNVNYYPSPDRPRTGPTTGTYGSGCLELGLTAVRPPKCG